MNIFLTLDYELFSSEQPGTPQKCIVDPMNALSKVAGKYGIKYTIFVDAAYLYRLYQLKQNFPHLKRDFELLKHNIEEMVHVGHDIQLHFHPQWIYTDYDGIESKWRMDTIHFKLSDMEPELAKKTFKEAKELLDSIIGYRSNCFRACGYCLDTYSNYIDLFKQNEIDKDSSVARYCYADSSAHVYDYRIIPDETIYRFDDSIKEKKENGQFTELSIASFKLNPVIYRLKLKKYREGYVYRDGAPLKVDVSNKESLLHCLIMPKRILASLDGRNSILLPYYLERSNRQHLTDLVICGHPKNTTEGSLKNLDKFLADNVGKHKFASSKDI